MGLQTDSNTQGARDGNVATGVAAAIRRFDEAGVRGVRQERDGGGQRRAGWAVDRRQRRAGARPLGGDASKDI